MLQYPNQGAVMTDQQSAQMVRIKIKVKLHIVCVKKVGNIVLIDDVTQW